MSFDETRYMADNATGEIELHPSAFAHVLPPVWPSTFRVSKSCQRKCSEDAGAEQEEKRIGPACRVAPHYQDTARSRIQP